MNHVKRAEAVRKQNIELLQKVDDLQKQIADMTEIDRQEKERLQSIFCELEIIKTKWCLAIEELENKKVEYQNLIYAMGEIKDIMFDMNVRIPWHQKMKMKILKHFR